MAVPEGGSDTVQPVHLGVERLLDTVRRQAELTWTSSPGPWDDPLFDAWVSCLEAVTSVGRAFDARAGAPPDDALVEELQNALSATRAAAASIRFSLVERTDRVREGER